MKNKRMRTRIGLALLVIAMAIGGEIVFGEKKTVDSVKLYLMHNYRMLKPGNQLEGLELLNRDLPGKQIFLTGEHHAVAANTELYTKFLHYFKEKTDFRYYLAEIPYSQGYYVNQYLASGDTAILDKLFGQLKGTFAWTKEYYSQWQEIYKLNQTLPEERKIRIVGIDVEFQIFPAFSYMLEVLPSNEAPQEIREGINQLQHIMKNGATVEEVKAFCERIKSSITANEDAYVKYLGAETALGFRLVNENVLNAMALQVSGASYNTIRDRYITANFCDIFPTLEEGARYYGQWGLKHILQRQQGTVDWFAGAMAEQLPQLKGKVLSIAYAYEDCYYLNKDNDNSSTPFDSINNGKIPLTTWKSLTGSQPFTLIRLNAKGSPFSKQLLWPLGREANSLPSGGVTTDYYQYLLVIQNSPAAKPLQP